jgi:hypothetical protein
MTFTRRSVLLPTLGLPDVRFTIPRNCDIAQNFSCDVKNAQILLIGVGPDKISTDNIRIVLRNAVYTPMVLKIVLPSETLVPQSVNLFYNEVILGDSSSKEIFGGALAYYTKPLEKTD